MKSWRPSHTVVVGVLVVLFAVLLICGPWLARCAFSVFMATITTRSFPPVSWADEAVETIVVDDSAELDVCWELLRSGPSDTDSGQAVMLVDTLVLPTGRVLATDLNFIEDNTPFRRPVPPGKYPVYELRMGRKTAAAVVVRQNASPTQWVIADAFGQAPASIRGVSLDSAAIFVDAVVHSKQSTYRPGPMIDGRATSVVVDAASGANAVTVHLGGVGVFPAYWGLDEESQPVVLLVLARGFVAETTADGRLIVGDIERIEGMDVRPEDLPRDATGDVLRRLLADGGDLSKPMLVDFAVAVPDAEAGEEVAAAARRLGFDTKVTRDEVDGSWTCTCTSIMLATHATITAHEQLLAEISHPYGGHYDGWGTFGNTDGEGE